MKLSDRKKKILQLVVDDYINTAQPVSSKSITEKYLTDISSATVRSELAQLEELGYLSQPHTSSGRVPSVEAYKVYVSQLMEKGKLTNKELGFIKNSFAEHTDNLETVVQNAVKVISELTEYTSVGYASPSESDTIVKIDLFRLKPNQALLLILTENTLIKDKYIDIPDNMTDKQITEARNMLSQMLTGKDFAQIIKLEQTVSEEFKGYREIFESVMNAIEEYINNVKPEVIMEGESNIMKHPEYSDTEKMKNFLSVVSSREKIASLLADNSDNIEINIKIGGEENGEMPLDCSMVTATYSASGVKLGTYGVIGPVRMDYQKVVSVLEGVGKILEDVLKNKK